jgi:hypothetical protein
MADLATELQGFQSISHTPSSEFKIATAAGVTVAKGALLKRVNATPTVVDHAGDDTVCKFAGIALQGGAPGDRIAIMTDGIAGPYTHADGSLTDSNIGDAVYMGADDQTVTSKASATNDQPIGLIASVLSATRVNIMIGKNIDALVRYVDANTTGDTLNLKHTVTGKTLAYAITGAISGGVATAAFVGVLTTINAILAHVVSTAATTLANATFVSLTAVSGTDAQLTVKKSDTTTAGDDAAVRFRVTVLGVV